jgi:hypothetical protein
MPDEEDDEKRKFRFPFMACEIFNAENSNILDRFVTPYVKGDLPKEEEDADDEADDEVI